MIQNVLLTSGLQLLMERRYAKEKGYKTPYSYGEILYLNTYYRNYSYYAPFMSATESSQSYDVRRAVYYKSDSYITSDYLNGIGASKALLWAESHDIVNSSYQGAGDIDALNETQINQAYAMQASRSDTAVLYVARPENSSTTMGNIGSLYYKDAVVKAANEFHNRYVGHSEYVDVSDGCFINRRGSGSMQGAMVVNITDYEQLNVNVGLANGTYLDLVSKNYVTVNNGRATISFTNKVCALVPESIPECYVVGNTAFTGTSESWSYSSGVAMSLTASNYGEVENVTVNEGSVIKVYDKGRDKWFGYDDLGADYAFATRDGDDNIALEEGIYHFYLNSSDVIYLVKASTDEPEVKTYSVTNMPNWIGDNNALADERAKQMDYKQFQKFIKSGQFVPLTDEELFVLDQVKTQSYNDITGFKLIRTEHDKAPSWQDKWNELANDINVVSGVYSYEASSWN